MTWREITFDELFLYQEGRFDLTKSELYKELVQSTRTFAPSFDVAQRIYLGRTDKDVFPRLEFCAVDGRSETVNLIGVGFSEVLNHKPRALFYYLEWKRGRSKKVSLLLEEKIVSLNIEVSKD